MKRGSITIAGRRLLVLMVVGLFAGCGRDDGGIKRDWIKQKWLDVPYATTSAAQKLDIYLPNDGEGPFPVVVAIHGGAFTGGDKASVEINSQLEAVKRGYAVVSINYRLSGEAKFPAQINDVKAAIRFIRASAGRYNLRPDQIAVWGGSAGGHLAALAGTSGDVKELEDPGLGNREQSSRVQAVVDWCAPINFLTMDEQNQKSGITEKVPNVRLHNIADSPISRLLGDRRLSEVPDLVKAANPETYITPDDPPFFIQHGTLDPEIPTQQSVEFAAALERVIGSDHVVLELLPGEGHGGPQFESLNNLNKIIDFLDKDFKRLAFRRTTETSPGASGAR